MSQMMKSEGAAVESLVARVVDGFLARQERGERPDPLLTAGGRLLGAAEITAGIALAVDSLHDV